MRIGRVTVSDRASAGVYEDRSGPEIERILREALGVDAQFLAVMVPDEQEQISGQLRELADQRHCDLIVTTGGTGVGPRDVTPEATRAVLEKELPGFGEVMRAQSFAKVRTAVLSRATAGTRGSTLILNLPGKPSAVAECLDILTPAILEGIAHLQGEDPHSNPVHFMRSKIFIFLTVLLFALSAANAAERPNILWITSEDNSPYLGCYGDSLAQTPHLDRFAAQGVRYRNAFANAPVCSSARTTLITGMYASSLGAQHHRSRVSIPEQFKLYPEHLRAAGYYCSNNSKTDYNVAGEPNPWDESGNRAHYQQRAPGQSFFAVFNFTTSHESQVAPKPGKTTFRVPPEQIPLPPYHPDTPDIRRDWANYYDQMTLMDQQVGKVLAGLEQAGIEEDTIVFYYGDHGGALPRGKRNIHDSGTRVPLIIRFPGKWQHLAPAQPGEWVDDLVSFVDFPATVFSLCGLPVPAHFEGQPFLGELKAAPREHVFLFRGRMDERYDTVRALRDGAFRYVRNYSPHRPWGQHYSYPFQVQPSMRSWFAEFTAGRCNEVQSAYWRPKPGEEFYELAGDPFELRNRIAEPMHTARVAQLRATLRAEILATRDTGFIPEGMFPKLAAERTIYDYARSDAYPLERILDLADKASDRNAAHLPAFIAALDDSDPVIRYWAATGCLILQSEAAPAKATLRARLNDEWPDVRVVAAEAIAHLGEREVAVETIAWVLKAGNLHEALAAQNALDFLWQAGLVPLDQAQNLMRGLNLAEPGDRIPRYLLSQP